jgi:hypothetical protein
MIEGMPLTLRFLSTGTWQHVFADANAESVRWVHKIPAAFGYILPFRHPNRLRPRKVATRTSYAFLARLAVGEKLLAARLKEQSCERFSEMLELVKFMCELGLRDILLPCEIVPTATAQLRVNDAVLAYSGPMLKQRSAEHLFEKSERLREIDWDALVEAHQRLWRKGITFNTSTAVLGLKNWALFEDRLRLFDTSSLTRDPSNMRFALSEAELDKKEFSIRANETVRCNSSEPLLEFFTYIRRELNSRTFEHLWRLDLRNDWQGEGPSRAAAINFAP